jgi:hypothetical protein
MHRISIYLRVLLIMGILLVLVGGIYSEHGFDIVPSIFTKDDASTFLKELGFASIIGFLVSVIIERAAREEEVLLFERYVKESGKNVLKAVYGNNISNELFDFIVKHVLSISFVRSEVLLTFDLKICKEESYGEYVIIKVRQESTITNISPADKTFEGSTAIEKTHGPRSVEINTIEYIRAMPNEGDFKVDTAYQELDRFRKKNYSIPATPNRPFRIHQSSTLSKSTTDNHIWRSNIVTERGRITINYPPEDFEINFDLLHAEFDPEKHSFRSPGAIVIAVDRPLLPHNGIMFWWSKKEKVEDRQDRA